MVYEIILHALSIITGEGKGEGRTEKEEKGRSDRRADLCLSKETLMTLEHIYGP